MILQYKQINLFTDNVKIILHRSLVNPGLMGPEHIRIGAIPDEPNSSTFFRNLHENTTKLHLHYFTVALMKLCTEGILKYDHCALKYELCCYFKTENFLPVNRYFTR